ncbi:tRNA lysidine(34) synthetase TilS [Vogesella sp. LIG4]|uniref:tRNA lysidine(34) synthetase TilS n=1 Tax=Vogesella sp. LIG4 TaxID=1192162 RepID=UPI00081FCEF5|nr:tRNA lysidine(34) synthetase TilS [Vogesella sp. LIG4]SCK26915.1 tRNA(Ile)-lysidine synthase [Vogesella sp. LIG4]
MQPDLLPQLIAHWPDKLSGLCHLELALSGGLDSCVLLHLLCRWRDEAGGPAVSAVHVHHGISRHADAWAAFCGQLCAQYGVALRVERVTLQRGGGQSLEALARAARYQAFAASPAPVVVLAQHADDQAETVLLQLLRGGGPRALAAMPTRRQWQGKTLWRPLLKVGRKVLRQYAEAHGLQWVEDDSNQDAANYLRNHLRLETLPALRQRLPQLDAQLQRSARRMADAAAILDDMAQLDRREAVSGDSLLLVRLLALSLPRQRNLLLHWLSQANWPLPAPDALDGLLAALAAGEEARLALPAGELYVYRGELRRVRAVTHPPPWPQACRVGEDWHGSHGVLHWQRGHGLPAAWQGRVVQLTARQGSDVLSLKVGRKAIKKLFQEQAVPALLRADWPLLRSADGELLGVPGVALAEIGLEAGGWWPQWLPAAVSRS